MFPCVQVTAAIRYLEFCVHKLSNTDRAIHNFLVSAYAKSKTEGDRAKLLKYLADQYKVSLPPYVNSIQCIPPLCSCQWSSMTLSMP